MATKRTSDKKRTARKSDKTGPEQVSGISAAAIEGASESSGGSTDNAEKMARPGPGMVSDPMHRHRGSPPADASHAPESGTERDIETDRTREASGPDEF